MYQVLHLIIHCGASHALRFQPYGPRQSSDRRPTRLLEVLGLPETSISEDPHLSFDQPSCAFIEACSTVEEARTRPYATMADNIYDEIEIEVRPDRHVEPPKSLG